MSGGNGAGAGHPRTFAQGVSSTAPDFPARVEVGAWESLEVQPAVIEEMSGEGETASKMGTGRWSEQLVAQQLRATLTSATVSWVNEGGEQGLPYDITIEEVSQHDETRYVEVKATVSDAKALFEMSIAEVNFARQALTLTRTLTTCNPNPSPSPTPNANQKPRWTLRGRKAPRTHSTVSSARARRLFTSPSCITSREVLDAAGSYCMRGHRGRCHRCEPRDSSVSDTWQCLTHMF